MLALSSLVTGLLAAWLVLMIGFPRVWATLVDKEYDYLVKKGVLPEGLSDRIRRIDKWSGIPIAVGVLFILYLFVTVMIAADRLS